MFPDMGRNPDILHVTLAWVIAAFNNQLEEMWKRVEAAEHTRLAAEEEAATKVESLRAEHQRALSDLKLKYDRALWSRYSGFVCRIQQFEASLASAQARQEAVAGELEAMNEEPSAESQEAELVVVPPNEDVDEVAIDGTQPVAEEGLLSGLVGKKGMQFRASGYLSNKNS